MVPRIDLVKSRNRRFHVGDDLAINGDQVSLMGHFPEILAAGKKSGVHKSGWVIRKGTPTLGVSRGTIKMGRRGRQGKVSRNDATTATGEGTGGWGGSNGVWERVLRGNFLFIRRRLLSSACFLGAILRPNQETSEPMAPKISINTPTAAISIDKAATHCMQTVSVSSIFPRSGGIEAD